MVDAAHFFAVGEDGAAHRSSDGGATWSSMPMGTSCLLYTSDAADERSSVDLGGRRIIKKKKQEETNKIEHTNNQQDEETNAHTRKQQEYN